MAKPEQKIQIAVANYIRLRYPQILMTISPISMISNKGAAILAVRMGYQKGTTDLIILEPRGIFHGLLIELKSEDGEPSDDQRIFIAKAHLLRYATAVCYNYEETVETIDRYMAQPPNYRGGGGSDVKNQDRQRLLSREGDDFTTGFGAEI